MQTAALAESSARGTLFARWHARGLGFGLAQLELARLLRIAALDERPSTFTITSTSGTVTGSKRLAGDTSTVSCTFTGNAFVVSISDLTAAYTATINGAQRSTGTATVSLEGLQAEGAGPPIFSEEFASPGVVQLTSKQQCKGGGWQSFGFKNQGDCVSFLATGGENPPSGS
jgi:hypothetical protein